MRFAYLASAPALLTCAVLAAQQPPDLIQPPPQTNVTQAPGPVVARTSIALQPSLKSGDSTARSQAKAEEHLRKEQEKAEAKAQKEADAERKDAEKQKGFLKLEDDQIAMDAFDDQGNPIKLPPCSGKDKVCQEKRKELLKQKRLPLHVQNGTLTVDGLTARARLNYDIPSFLYLYLSMPGYGTVVVSPVHFPHSTEQKEALDGKTMTITTADDHTIQITSETTLSGRQKHTVFFSVDRSYQQPGKRIAIGYGLLNRPPYVWPDSQLLGEEQKQHAAQTPAQPKIIQTRQPKLPCASFLADQAHEEDRLASAPDGRSSCRTGSVAGMYPAAEHPASTSGVVVGSAIADPKLP